MSLLQKEHVLGAGGSAIVAGAVGALGIAIGAAAGGALGAFAGHKTTEAVDAHGELDHFKQIYRSTCYYTSGMGWEDYAPAYRYGLDAHARLGCGDFSAYETELEAG